MRTHRKVAKKKEDVEDEGKHTIWTIMRDLSSKLPEQVSSICLFSLNKVYVNVADPGCFSRIRKFFHPGSWIHQREGKKINSKFPPV
jgi:hypothetical protein